MPGQLGDLFKITHIETELESRSLDSQSLEHNIAIPFLNYFDLIINLHKYTSYIIHEFQV